MLSGGVEDGQVCTRGSSPFGNGGDELNSIFNLPSLVRDLL